MTHSFTQIIMDRIPIYVVATLKKVKGNTKHFSSFISITRLFEGSTYIVYLFQNTVYFIINAEGVLTSLLELGCISFSERQIEICILF